MLSFNALNFIQLVQRKVLVKETTVNTQYFPNIIDLLGVFSVPSQVSKILRRFSGLIFFIFTHN